VGSQVPGYNLRKPRELTRADIDRLIERFARTAELAIAGGFDGVQVHAALQGAGSGHRGEVGRRRCGAHRPLS